MEIKWIEEKGYKTNYVKDKKTNPYNTQSDYAISKYNLRCNTLDINISDHLPVYFFT